MFLITYHINCRVKSISKTTDQVKFEILQGGILLTNYRRSIHQIPVLKIKNKYKNSFVAIKGQCIKIERPDKGAMNKQGEMEWTMKMKMMMITIW